MTEHTENPLASSDSIETAPASDKPPEIPTPIDAPPLAKGSLAMAALREIVETVALFAVIFTVARFSIGNFIIVGQSMEPNYHQDQRLLVDRISPMLGWLQRGDVVILHSPVEEIDLIKRLIGKPGDTIELRDNRVYVNGEALNEPYLPPNADSGPKTGSATWKLGPDEYFVMGDNRSASQDSRFFGTAEYKYLIGRALLLYYPFSDFHVVQHYKYQ